MKALISFCGLQERQKALKTNRLFPLQPLAGSTILGHILERLKDLVVDEYIIMVNEGVGLVQNWVDETFPDHNFQIAAVTGKTPLDGLNHYAKDNPGSLLFVSGEFVTEADYQYLSQQESDLICLVQQGQDIIPTETVPLDENGFFTGEWGETQSMWAGCLLFNQPTALQAIKADPGFQSNPYLNTLLTALDSQGWKIGVNGVQNCFGTGTPQRLLHANARLMQLGYCSDDAIERSYSEEFTVLPPVFIHETAVIENAIVGPFVNCEAGAVLSNCIVSNSLIGQDAEVQDVVIEESFIGDGTKFSSARQSVIIGEDSPETVK